MANGITETNRITDNGITGWPGKNCGVTFKLKPEKFHGLSHGRIYGQTVRHSGSMCKGPGEISLSYLQDRNLTRVARHRALCVWLKI